MTKLDLKGLLKDLSRQQKAEALASAFKIYSPDRSVDLFTINGDDVAMPPILLQ